MFHSGGGGMAAAAPHEPVEQRQRQKPEPKRAWLDAIMSKTRHTDASPFASAGSTPSSASGVSYMGGASRSSGAVQMGLARKGAVTSSSPASLPPPSMGGVPQHQQQQDRWDPNATTGRVGHFSGGPVRSQAKQFDPPIHAGGVPAEYYQQQAAPPSQPATTSSDLYHEQLDLDDSILAETMSLAFKQMVGEQDCCFIAKGICHLCGTNERHLIPVVNFCPEFHVNHSLCREHLRSMHRVRMEDIFAGKNRPTVSKRSLKCSVCSRSCPCSTCQLEKQHEISKYKRWLAGEREYELDSEDRSMGSDHLRMRNPANPAPLSKKPQRGSFGSITSGGSGGYEYLPDAGRSIRELYGSQRRHVEDAQPSAFQAPPAPPQVDLSQEDDLRLLPSLQAGAKLPSHSYRGVKRAAKDVVTSAHPTALDVTGSGPSAFGPHAMEQSPPNRVHPGEPLESPSAAHVLNCAESEKSLVRLLTTLNQEVASTVPAFADPKDPAGTLPPLPPNGAKLLAPAPRRTPSPAEDHPMPSRSPDARSSDAERGGSRASAYAGDAAAPSSSNRNPKRKREANDSVHADSETSSEMSASNSNSKAGPGRKLTTHKRGEVLSSARGAVPDRETAPKPSPTAKAGAKGKQKDARQRAAPKASPSSGRKRNGDPSSNAHQSDKKSPAPRKPATPAARGNTPRGGQKDGRAGSKNAAGKRQSVQEDDDDDDDSEIDTNLDYCEVCFAAGDLVCCDVCPRSFHLACLKMRESDLPEGDWQCAECRKPSFFVRYRATVDMKQSIYGKCVEAIRCLKSHPYSKQFLSPVTNIEHYRKIVKQPMDLSTIEGKLTSDKYTKPPSGQQQGEKIIDIDAFANDVRLVWSNCKLFNDDGSGITRAADELAAGFEDIYQDLKHYLKTLSARNAAKAASKPAASRAESSTPSQPSKPGTPSSGSTAPVPPEGKKTVATAGSASKSAASPAPVSSAKVDEPKQPKVPASASASASSTESDTGRPPAAANRAPSSSTTEAKSTPAQKTAEAAPSASPSSTESESKASADSKFKSSNNSEESKGGKS